MDKVVVGILIPLLGTSIGAMMVFFIKEKISLRLQKILLGFSAGVMIASSIWSLIIPSLEKSTHLKWAHWIPTAIGIILGFVFLILIEYICDKINKKNSLKQKSLLFFSITLHNIPEGMAVGVALACAYYGQTLLSLSSAIALSVGIAIQNIPEGAIISIPQKILGKSKLKSFCLGVLSGVVEPIFAMITFFVTGIIVPVLPYILTFAAGSMLYVSIKELIPYSIGESQSNFGAIGFFLCFIIMFILDVALG